MVSARVNLWLSTCLEEQISVTTLGAEDQVFTAELFDGLLQHARYTKVSVTQSRQPIVLIP